MAAERICNRPGGPEAGARESVPEIAGHPSNGTAEKRIVFGSKAPRCPPVGTPAPARRHRIRATRSMSSVCCGKQRARL
jgi:hypothetical protein